MISIDDESNVKFYGEGVDLLVEYAVITNRLKATFIKGGASYEAAEELIKDAFEMGMGNEETRLLEMIGMMIEQGVQP